MGSHSYLVNLETNIGALRTEGLLNSEANRFTTTNVGRMNGGRQSVINLGLMEMPTNIGVLGTQGLLNSVANRHTTTNVGELDGSRNSVIILGFRWSPRARMGLR